MHLRKVVLAQAFDMMCKPKEKLEVEKVFIGDLRERYAELEEKNKEQRAEIIDLKGHKACNG